MTDRYENIRKALEMGPTPGEWYWSDAYPTQDGRKTWSLIGDGGFGILSCDGDENSPLSVDVAAAELIAACDPDTIRELLDERDALKAENERLREDKARLDFLDACNQRLNSTYGTSYGWKMVMNHNVNRLMTGHHLDMDLNDFEVFGANSCRQAIDAERRRVEGTRSTLEGGE